MNLKYSIMLVLFLVSWHASTCDIPFGKYEQWSASEWERYIILKEEGAAELVYSSWLPSGYDNRTITKEKAKWSCQGNYLEIERNGKTDRGIFVFHSLIPYGIELEGHALIFADLKHSSFSNNVTFWQHK